ncbi:Ppx/GppA family phosphatase [Acuticoccus sp.]|uniref:Ppx/GppA family phosphatase n=1 Tax=Acuticoccus sp. TaxID=1904378 RepID=UPI003B52B980
MTEMPEARSLPRGTRMGEGIAVIDVGSNSVRLVIYERASRAPTVMFNEKVLAALGEGLAENGRLGEEAMGRALFAVRRFMALVQAAEVAQVTILATAAARVATNGNDFIGELEAISQLKVRVLTGPQEAQMAAAGVLCGFWRPDGIVGDLGGGSLELIDVSDAGLGTGESRPLGTLRLRGDAKGSVSRGAGLARNALEGSEALQRLAGRAFYAVGGTWRSIVKLHMAVTDYPISIMHQYAVPGPQMMDFCDEVLRVGLDTMDKGGVVAKGRRALVPWGAVVLRTLIDLGRPATVVASGLGVREGTIYDGLDEAERRRDPLTLAAEELAVLRNRSPRHSAELIAFTRAGLDALGLAEDGEEERLRHAACLLSDISWRAHPDYRADQALAIVSNVALYGVDHAGRGFLAKVLNDRYGGTEDPVLKPGAEALCSEAMGERARLVAAMLRLGYVLAPGIANVLPKVQLMSDAATLVLELPDELATFDGERPQRRVRQLAKLTGREGVIRIA